MVVMHDKREKWMIVSTTQSKMIPVLEWNEEDGMINIFFWNQSLKNVTAMVWPFL